MENLVNAGRTPTLWRASACLYLLTRTDAVQRHAKAQRIIDPASRWIRQHMKNCEFARSVYIHNWFPPTMGKAPAPAVAFHPSSIAAVAAELALAIADVARAPKRANERGHYVNRLRNSIQKHLESRATDYRSSLMHWLMSASAVALGAPSVHNAIYDQTGEPRPYWEAVELLLRDIESKQRSSANL